MSFASYDFLLVFLPAVVLTAWLCFLVDAKRLLVPAIIVSSVIFYGYTSLPHLLLILSLILATWILGQLYFPRKGTRIGAVLLTLGVLLNLSSLLIWKYGSSIVEAWNELGLIQANDPGLIVPLGISFYSVQMIGFLLDMQRNKTKPSSLLSFVAFVLFFPQLIAGPIVSHRRMMREFDKSRTILTWDDRFDMASRGMTWIAVGLFKKAVIADSIARATLPYIVGASAGDITMIEAWAVVMSSGVRLYYDFSGYCDIAVGIGLLFGVALPPNFDAPGRLSTIAVGWRRWHITFHNFLRDHVYRHLKRIFGESKLGVMGAILIVFLLSGLWHGNDIAFLGWGLLCGVSWIFVSSVLALPPSRLRTTLQIVTMSTLYMIVPLIFVVPDMGVGMHILSQLFSVQTLPASGGELMERGGWTILMLIAVYLVFTSEISTQNLVSTNKLHRERVFWGYRPPIWKADLKWAAFTTVLLAISLYFVGLSPPFIYFRF